VETSGDGATNFYSRIQMYMFKARLAAEAELKKAFEDCGVTREEVQAFLDKNPKYASPLHHSPHKVASSAANLVWEVAPLIKLTAMERAQLRAKELGAAVVDAVKAAPAKAAAAKAFVTDPENKERLEQDWLLIRDVLSGKAKERFGPLVRKLAGKAYFENNPEVSHLGYNEEAIAAEE
jgi:hypothetical protein